MILLIKTKILQISYMILSQKSIENGGKAGFYNKKINYDFIIKIHSFFII
jgi:hypothetical protein